MPINGLNRKMLRQPMCSVRMPPSVGPMARPTAAMPVQIPIARAFAAGSGYAAPTNASEVTLTTAAPIPWRPRAAMSTPSPGASPHPSDATQKITIPTM